MPPVSGMFTVSSRRLVSAARSGTLQHLRHYVRSTGFVIRRTATGNKSRGVYTAGTFGTGGTFSIFDIIRTLESGQQVHGMESVVQELQKMYEIIGRREELKAALIAAKAGKHILLEGIDGDERYTEQKLAGWYDPPLVLAKGYTKESFIHGPLSTTMLDGAILLINELNRMPEGTQNVMLSAMDEQTIYIPKFGRVDAKEGFMIIATQNPDEYIGTSQLSEALKDRFICINLGYQSYDEEAAIVSLRSGCSDRDIIDVSVAIARMTREEEEIRRGSSVRGAIDLADIFSTTYGSFDDDQDKWVLCAKLSFLTKIELQDFSHEKFLEILKRLASKALETHNQKGIPAGASGMAPKAEIDQSKLAAIEKKK